MLFRSVHLCSGREIRISSKQTSDRYNYRTKSVLSELSSDKRLYWPLLSSSEEKTKKARRQAQRRREHEKNISPAKPFPTTPMASSIPTPTSEAGSDLTFDDIDDFGDIA